MISLVIADAASTYMLTCSEQLMTVNCPFPLVIRVDSVMYGHYDDQLCGGVTVNTNCHLEEGFDIVDGLCSGLQSCAVPISRTTFDTDPCYRTSKYLELEYTCVSSEYVLSSFSRIFWIFFQLDKIPKYVYIQI